MRVAKWGNSLAIRLPSAVVDALALKEGDDIDVRITGERSFEIARNQEHQRALERLRALKWKLPPGFIFDRDEAHER